MTWQPHDLEPGDARELLDSIRDATTMLWPLIVEAWRGQAWKALGYTTWTACCDAELGGCRLKLPADERRGVVADLDHQGMSTRAIAAAIGVSNSTVHSDLAGVRNRTPDAPTPTELKSRAAALAQGFADQARGHLDAMVDGSRPLLTGHWSELAGTLAPQRREAYAMHGLLGSTAGTVPDVFASECSARLGRDLDVWEAIDEFFVRCDHWLAARRLTYPATVAYLADEVDLDPEVVELALRDDLDGYYAAVNGEGRTVTGMDGKRYSKPPRSSICATNRTVSICAQLGRIGCRLDRLQPSELVDVIPDLEKLLDRAHARVAA